MTQPIWKLLYSTDTEALYEDTTSVYDPELAILDEYETERGTTRYYVYRFDLPQCQLIGDTVCDSNGNVEWFSSDLASVMNSCDHPTIAEDLCSPDVKARARAYASLAGYHGNYEFDQYPQDVTPSQAKNWPDLDGKAEVRISTNDEDTGYVTLYCDDVEAARDDGSVLDGQSRWEISNDLAYTTVQECTNLKEALEAEGYDVDSSEWSPPDDQDLLFWHAKFERESGRATPEKLREILGWTCMGSLASDRRVQDATRYLDDSEINTYLLACWDAGFVLDSKKALQNPTP